jgi:hypothetical protein
VTLDSANAQRVIALTRVSLIWGMLQPGLLARPDLGRWRGEILNHHAAAASNGPSEAIRSLKRRLFDVVYRALTHDTNHTPRGPVGGQWSWS